MPRGITAARRSSSAIKVRPKSSSSRFVALDGKDRSTIIAEGRTAEATAKKARKTGEGYIIMYIPAQGHTYVF